MKFPVFSTPKMETHAELETHLVGSQYLYPRAAWILKQWGPVDGLEGTDNTWWVAYFQGGDFTLLVEKKTDTILALRPGKHPGHWGPAKRKRRQAWKH